MATLCKNCGGPLIFEPSNGRMLCKTCGATYDVKDIDITDKELLEEIEALSAKEVFGTDDVRYYDCNVYTCNSCGGDVIINNTEASTYCMYCGNPTIVFSRVSKQRRPEFILPFSITKEQAIRNIKATIDRGFFVPKEIKNFDPELVRGIYIPYWIIKADHYNAAFIKGEVPSGSGKNKRYVKQYYGRAGEFHIQNMTLDASDALNDNSSMKLEPFDLTALKDFDENYLTGFYSDIADVTGPKVAAAANVRADLMFREEALSDVRVTNMKVLNSEPYTKVDDDMVYAMMPCWFVTIKYKDEPLTILVNGDSGKVVCTLPFNKALFITLVVITAILIGVACAFGTKLLLSLFFSTSSYRHSSRSSGNFGRILIYAGAAAASALTVAVKRIQKILKNLNLTRSTATFKYVKRRQG